MLRGLCCGLVLGALLGCNGIVGEAPSTREQKVYLPVSPSHCQALYRIPASEVGPGGELVFPPGTKLAEMPASVEGVPGASCTLVVRKGPGEQRQSYWRIRTQEAGVSGALRCHLDGHSSPEFAIQALSRQGAEFYVYAPVDRQEQVMSLLQAGKITATWHKGERGNDELYERGSDGALQPKKNISLYKACPR